MPITTLPPAPSRAEPSTFSAKGDALLGALAAFVTEANALETNVNAKEVSATEQAVLATEQPVLADASADVALSASNYKGPWASLSGAADVPFAVSHLGKYWQLASNIPDITLKVPGTASEWLLIEPGITWSLITGITTAIAGNGYICDTSGAAFTLTLPASPSAGNVVAISDGASTFDSHNLTIGRNSLKIMGLSEDMIISTKNVAISLIYSDATNGWRIA